MPVQIYFDSDDKYVRKLKAGMSAYTTIDTGHRRSARCAARVEAGERPDQD